MACVAHTDAGCHLSELARLLAVSRRADGQDPREVLAGGVRSDLDRVAQNRTESRVAYETRSAPATRDGDLGDDPPGIFKQLSKAVEGDVRLRIGGIEHPADTS